MKKKKIVVMRSYIVSLSCLYLMICSSCGNPRSGESKNEDNTKEIEIVKKEPITYNFYVENSGSVKGFFKGNTNDAGNILKEFYDRIEENKGDDDTISLNYINNKINPQKITINKWLNQIHGKCTSPFSDIDKVLEQILLTTNDNTINILLSDYCFESRFGNLDKAKSEITNIFTKGINKYNDLSIAIYKYEASFDGFFQNGAWHRRKTVVSYKSCGASIIRRANAMNDVSERLSAARSGETREKQRFGKHRRKTCTGMPFPSMHR